MRDREHPRTPTAESSGDLALIEGALRRNADACRILVDRLTPAIQRQVNAALVRSRRGSRQDVFDLTQEIFRILLENDGRILRSWDPARGASLEGWVALVAERRVLNILSSGRKSGHAEDPTDPADLDDDASDAETPELKAISKQQLEQLLAGLETRLSGQGLEMFRLLFVEEREVSWIMDHQGMSRDAVYAWRARIRKTLMKVFERIESDPATQPGRKQQGTL